MRVEDVLVNQLLKWQYLASDETRNERVIW
jgi:hypothetical protein